MITYNLENSKENLPTIYIIDNDNKKKYIHSKYYPSKDSLTFDLNFDYEKFDFLIIFGLGLGYHLEKLKDINNKFTKIIIIDPIETLIDELKKNQNLAWLLNSKNIYLILKNNINIIEKEINSLLDLSKIKGIKVLDHKGSVYAFPEFYKKVKDIINNVINNKTVNKITKNTFGSLFIKNSIKKINNLNRFYPVKNLFNKFKNLPALVISSAPSIDKQIGWIYKYQSNMLIIAVDSALPVLLNNNIKPNIIISIDPQPWIYEHFINNKIPEKTILISSISSYYIEHKHNFLSLNSHPFAQVIEEIYPQHYGNINSKTGNVAGDAINAAFLLGCNPIGLAGLDFSFPFYNIYSKDTAYQSRFINKNINKFNTIENYNINYIFNSSKKYKYNEKYSRKAFIAYKENITNLISTYKDIKIFNINKYGIKIENIINIENEDEFLKYLQSNNKVINNLLTSVDNFINNIKVDKLTLLLKDKNIFNKILTECDIANNSNDKFYKLLKFINK